MPFNYIINNLSAYWANRLQTIHTRNKRGDRYTILDREYETTTGNYSKPDAYKRCTKQNNKAGRYRFQVKRIADKPYAVQTMIEMTKGKL